MRAADSLADLFAADRREHAAPPPVGTADYAALRRHDGRRRRRAAAILAVLGEPAAADLYHAAWLFNHGDTPEDARRARELTRTEPQPSLRRAPRWLRDALVRWGVGDPGAGPGVEP